MICYLCKNNFKTIELLILHFKRIHDLKTRSTFRCIEKYCYQVFQDLGSFKRHAIRKHASKLEKEIDIHKNVTEIPDKSNSTSCERKILQETESGFDKITEHYQEEYDLKLELDSFFKSAVKLSLKLHSNNNFNRKDVYEIQKSVK